MMTQLPLWTEPPAPVVLPYGACTRCGVVLDWRTLPRLFGYPCWPRYCPTCHSDGGFWTRGPDRPNHPEAV